jgi:GNAT superfamily N-acetyltransferase
MMTTAYTIRLAELVWDWDELSRLRTGVEARLRQMQGTEPTDMARGLDRMAGYVQRDQMYVITEGRQIIACHALTPDGDTAFWDARELGEEALYLDNAMVRPDYMGRGLGGVITGHAAAEARSRTMDALRLDCQRGNERLRAHWELLGFTWLRDEDVPGRSSGTLMEMKIE